MTDSNNAPGNELPPMSDALLDERAIEALFRDVGELTQIDEIIIKQGRGMVEDQQNVTLDMAKSLLATKAVRGVQIRYRHNGAHWWDTLMPVAEGVRLVRVKHDFT